MSINSFYSYEELTTIGLKCFGENVLISKKASIYNPDLIEIGSNVRIDDFCILSGNIKLGSYIHISAYTALYGKYGIEINDFSGLSPRCTVFSASDDFSGDYLIGPMVDPKYTNIVKGKVLLMKHVQVGAGSIILPNIIISEGVSIGSMSLVNKSLPEWQIYFGVPAKRYKDRSRNIVDLEIKFKTELHG